MTANPPEPPDPLADDPLADDPLADESPSDEAPSPYPPADETTSDPFSDLSDQPADRRGHPVDPLEDPRGGQDVDWESAVAPPAPPSGSQAARERRRRWRRRRRVIGTLLFLAIVVGVGVIVAVAAGVFDDDSSPEVGAGADGASASSSSTTTTAAPTFGPYRVTDGLNVRTGPAPSYPSIGTVEVGVEVTVLCQIQGQPISGPIGTTDKWVRIVVPFGGYGYVTAQYVATGADLVVPNLVPACPSV